MHTTLDKDYLKQILTTNTNKDSFGKIIYESLNEVFIFDAETFEFIDVNKGALMNIGYSLAELKNLIPTDIKPEFDLKSFEKLVIPLRNRSQEKIVFSTTHQRKDGSTYPTETHLQLLPYNGKPAFIAISLDMSHHQQKQEKSEWMAYHDGLTGLPSRSLFSDRLQQAIALNKRSASLLAICFINIDDFKSINKNLGHSIGDKLLVDVARRSQSVIREGDTISRLRGDEFTLLLNDIESFDVCKQTLERVHQSLSQPYLIDGESYHITVSMGVTVYPLDESDTYTLVTHAANAMHQAKSAGKNQLQFFSISEGHEH